MLLLQASRDDDDDEQEGSQMVLVAVGCEMDLLTLSSSWPCEGSAGVGGLCLLMEADESTLINSSSIIIIIIVAVINPIHPIINFTHQR